MPADAYNQAGKQTVPCLELRETEQQSPRQEEGYHQCTGGSFPGLFRADVAAEQCSAEQLATHISGHVAQLHRHNQKTQVTVGLSGVSQERQVPKHPAEIQEPHDGQGERLKLAFCSIANDWDRHDHGDHEYGQCHEESVPPRAAVAGVGHQGDDARGTYSQVYRCGHGPVAVQAGGTSKFSKAEYGDESHKDDDGLAPE